MGLLDQLKNRIGRSQLRQELATDSRRKQMLNLEDAKTVGIIFEYTSAEEFELLRKYVNYLREMKKRVHAIGLFTTKELPQFNYSKVDFDFFGKKATNWIGKPADTTVQAFIDEERDILIDLNLNNQFALHYIAAHAQAGFKIGRFVEDDDHVHDLLLDCPPEKGLKYFLRQVDTYLLKINR
ncbi:MAG: DUF6913 domain-containing protein [Bacteroidia bacterium]